MNAISATSTLNTEITATSGDNQWAENRSATPKRGSYKFPPLSLNRNDAEKSSHHQSA